MDDHTEMFLKELSEDITNWYRTENIYIKLYNSYISYSLSLWPETSRFILNLEIQASNELQKNVSTQNGLSTV